MEEQGTEILFRPGTENNQKELVSPKRQSGAQLNVLQHCTIGETDEWAVHKKVLPSTHSRSDDMGGNSSPTSAPSPSTTEKEQRQESATSRAFFPVSTREQYSHPEPNRFDSLVENATTDEDDISISSDDVKDGENNCNKYHPALKAAVHNEGQEAVWHEDEYSTISSIYVKPENNTTSERIPEVLPTRSQNSRKKIRVPFFKSRGKKTSKEKHISDEVESTPRPVKIHIKTKRIAKAVLLLPPKEASVETSEDNVEEDKRNDENERLERYESISKNSIQARQLLDTVLSEDGLDEEESERVAKEAFDHATAARRLAHRSGIQSPTVDDSGVDEEAIELENIISYLAEEGEQAALQHRRLYSFDDAKNDADDKDKDQQQGKEYAKAIDLTMTETNESTKMKKKRRGKFQVSGYASRAVHYLESILPKNIGNDRDGDDIVAPSSNASNAFEAFEAVDFWSDAGISTLGLKNDTLEYGLNLDDGGFGTDHDGAGLLRNTDMMSLSSLNEILDGGGTNQLENSNIVNEGERSRRQSTGEPSPRAAVKEIGIPQKKKIGLPPTHPRHNRTRLLGLITPKIVKPSNHSDKKGQADNVDNSSKKWGVFFKTPRASSDEVPSQLNLVLEKSEENHPEALSREEIKPTSSSSKSCTPSNDSKRSEAKELVVVDSDSYLNVPEANRYAPAFVDEISKETIPQEKKIKLKLSTATVNSQNLEKRYEDDDVLSENNVKPRPSSPSQDESSKASISNKEARNDLSISNDDESDNQRSIDRYQTEPVGKTPRRDELKMEENKNRKPQVAQFEIRTTSAIKEQNNQKECITRQIDSDEKATRKKNTVKNAGLACDPMEKSDSVSKNPVEGETNICAVEEREDNTSKVNDVAVANIKPIILPVKNDDHKKRGHPKCEREEMSTAESEGSKSKIFGRVVDMIGRNKRKPLIPIAVVEEKYFVDNDTKKISTGLHQIHGSMKPTFTNTLKKKEEFEKDIQKPIAASKSALTQSVKVTSQKKKKSMGPSLNLVDDSITVVQNAISNGNLKAVESNEEGDDVVPLNYLSVMLRRKLYEEKVNALHNDATNDTGEAPQQCSSEEKLDADSFVAAIRGPRRKEAPGVALEEIAIRNNKNNRDPRTGKDTKKVLVDLAPTPRGPEGRLSTFDTDEEETHDDKDCVPPIKEEEEERQRRKLITERLFQAGSSSFQEEMTTTKETSDDVINTAPTVASAESYCEEPVQEDPDVESSAKKETLEKHKEHEGPHSKFNLGRGRRMLSISFLKGNKRK